MNKYLIFITLLFIVNFSTAQSITGEIKGGDNKQINNFQIIILNNVDKYIGEIDSKKFFIFKNVKKGDYSIKIINNDTLIYEENISVKSSDIIHNIELNKSHLIERVVIQKNKKIFEDKLDKSIFNVSESIYSNGFNAADVLGKAPLVKVEDNGISIINRGKVLLLINDRRMYLDGNDLINYLKSIQSSTISKIEIMTNPSSKYDAQGAVGIVNILLKKDFNKLLNINYSSSFTKKKGEGLLNSFAISYNKNDLQITSRLNYSEQSQINRLYSKLIKGDVIINESDIEQNIKNVGKGAFTSINYKFSKKIDIGIDLDFRHIDSDNLSKNLSSFSIDNKEIFNTKKTINSTINLYGTYLIDSLGKKIEIGGTSFFNKNDIDQNIDAKITNLNSNFTYKILSGQADLTLPLKNELEFLSGIKILNVKNEQSYVFNQDFKRSNFFESIYAAYISAAYKLTDKIYLKGGIRFENYQNEFTNIETNQINNTNYSSLFPTFFADYKINDDNKISISYNRRINRPNFRYLDPFRIYYTENYYQTGNPNLSAYYSNNIELKYNLKNFNILLYRTENKNMYSSVTKIEGDSQVDNFENFFDLITTGINVRYNFNKIKFIESSLTTNLAYSDVKIRKDFIEPRRGIIFFYYIDNNIFLNEKKTIFANFSYLHSFPTNSINSYLGNVANFSGGLKILLMEKQMQLNLSFNDLFRQQRDRGVYYYNGYNNEVKEYRDYQSVTFGFSYTFGKAKAKNNKRLIYERNRTE